MKTLFAILVVLFIVAVCVWLYTIISPYHRENLNFLYPLIAILILNFAIQICAFIGR